MKNKENARASIIKMLIICIAIIFGLGLAVKAGNIQVNSVKIELSDHTELNVMTSKTKVSEILNENQIIILEGEKVIPDLEEEIGEDKTIRIVKESEEITISQTSNEEVKQERLYFGINLRFSTKLLLTVKNYACGLQILDQDKSIS